MLSVKYADLTQEHVDAVVNAANAGLYAGAGVCGAIHSAGGPQVLEECMALPGIKVDADNPPNREEFLARIENGGETEKEEGFLGAFRDRGTYFMRCPTGDVRSTTAGEMPASYVIHAVGPIWEGGDNQEEAQLASVHRRIIEEAARLGCQSVALPAISTGIFGFPLERAAQLAVENLQVAMQENPSVTDVRICVIDERTGSAFENALAILESKQ